MRIKSRLTMLAIVTTTGLCMREGVMGYTQFGLGQFIRHLVTGDLPSAINRVISTIANSNEETGKAMAATVAQVETGMQRADMAKDAIKHIGGTTRELVGNIAVSIRQQASTDIALQVDHIARMAQNANDDASTASAAPQHALDDSAHRMPDIVAVYPL